MFGGPGKEASVAVWHFLAFCEKVGLVVSMLVAAAAERFGDELDV